MFWAVRPQEFVRNEYVVKGKSMVKAIYAVNAGVYPDFYGKRYYFSLFFMLIFYPFEYTFYYSIYVHSISTCIAYREVRLIGISVCCGTVVYLYGIVTVWCISNKEAMDKVMEMVGRGFCKYSRPLTKGEQRLLDQPKRNTERYAVASSLALIVMSLIHFWILPILKVIQTGTWSTVKNGSIPFSDNDVIPVYAFFGTEVWWTYIPKYLHEAGAASFQYTITNGYAILYVGVSQQLVGNLKLLSTSLADIHARSLYLYNKSGRSQTTDDLYSDKYFLKCMNICLKENVQHHVNLINFFHALQKIVGVGVLVTFTGVAIIISTSAYTSIYLVTQAQFENKGILTTSLAVWSLYTLGYMALLIIYCQYGQLVIDESDRLLYSFYNTPWIYCDLSFRKSLTIAMSICQTNMKITGLGLIPASRVSIIDIIKTSFSYLNILLASLNR